ncbi:MAG: acyl-CoA dehydrogenase family protein [SAR324 cluster bacterium]|nr:acyl-CoA dehydrogenase family protein [SAR324 cluster bacterium]
MNINDSPQAAGLREELREWIEQEVPAGLKGRKQNLLADETLTRQDWRPLLDALHRKGWLAPAWPLEHGGAGFDVGKMIVFNEEWIRAGLPQFRSDGLDKIGPTLIAVGTEAQQARFLEATRKREIIWAQGYSEPDAGSDLASLSLRADKVDGGYKLNGQKIWTSNAHNADWMYVLARTDQNAQPRHAGISMMIFDAQDPGFTISPITTIDGFHHFNQTFYDDIFVPEDQVLGGVNQGWKVSNILLGHERFSHPACNPMYHEYAIRELKQMAREEPRGGGVAWDDLRLRRRVVELEMDTDCLRYLRYRAQSQIAKTGVPGPEASIFKVLGAELLQRIVDTHQDMTGPLGVSWENAPFGEPMRDLARRSARSRGYTIAGGTKEIQRNIVSKRVLGLPE